MRYQCLLICVVAASAHFLNHEENLTNNHVKHHDFDLEEEEEGATVHNFPSYGLPDPPIHHTPCFNKRSPNRLACAKADKCLCRYIGTVRVLQRDRLIKVSNSKNCVKHCLKNIPADHILCGVYSRDKKESDGWKRNKKFVKSFPELKVGNRANALKTLGVFDDRRLCINHVPFRKLKTPEPIYSDPAPVTTRISFIWWGKPTVGDKYEKQATASPNMIAQLLDSKGSDIKVYYYHQLDDRDTSAFTLLDDKIIQVSIADPWNGKKCPQAVLSANHFCVESPGDILYFELPTSAPRKLDAMVDDINEVIEKYDSVYGARSFAAAKDLIALAVLYATGGYFFDTNVDFIDDSDIALRNFPLLLTRFAQRKIPAYPALNNDRAAVNSATVATLETSADNAAVMASPNGDSFEVVKTPKLEYNGGFSPKACPFTRYAIKQYCLFFKFRTSTKTPKGSVGAVSPSAFLEDAFKTGSEDFKIYVGNVIRSALADAARKWMQKENVMFNSIIFPVRLFVPDVTPELDPKYAKADFSTLHFLPFNLRKSYGSSWRKVATPPQVDDSQEDSDPTTVQIVKKTSHKRKVPSSTLRESANTFRDSVESRQRQETTTTSEDFYSAVSDQQSSISTMGNTDDEATEDEQHSRKRRKVVRGKGKEPDVGSF